MNLVQNFNRVTFQFFGDAQATISLDLSKLFPVPDGAKLELSKAISTMLEINIGNTNPLGLHQRGGIHEADTDNTALALPYQNESDYVNVWYETLDNTSRFRFNTHMAAQDLCKSKGKPFQYTCIQLSF